jgi:hypothetical protein
MRKGSILMAGDMVFVSVCVSRLIREERVSLASHLRAHRNSTKRHFITRERKRSGSGIETRYTR